MCAEVAATETSKDIEEDFKHPTGVTPEDMEKHRRISKVYLELLDAGYASATSGLPN